MLHIYRQITGLSRYRPVVFTQKRENADRFPFEPVKLFPRPSTQWLRRWWQKQVCGKPVSLETRRVQAVRQALEATHATVLHVYFGHIGVYMLPLLQQSRVPVVVSFHGADAGVDLHRPKYRKATQRMLQLAAGVLVRSDAMAQQLRLLGCDPGKIHRHRTGIPLDEFRFVERERPGDDAWHVVQACRLIEKKGLPVSLRAFAAFTRVYPNARFTIAGEGPLQPALQQLAGELGIAGKVTFAGFLRSDDLRALYNQAHFFIHPSETGADGNQEGVPNSMLEAMATGLPALATRHGGIPEAVEDGVSGVLVPERAVEVLTEKWLSLAASPERYRAMAHAGSEAVREKFELRAQVAVLESIYDRVQGCSSGRLACS